jgi:quercetin dioxygenase-like cupin family protein
MPNDALEAAPNVYTVLFENERLRLIEARVKPGDSSPLHSHPAGLIYVVSGGQVAFTSSSGERVDVELQAGQTRWREAEEHAATNRDSKDVVVLLIEPK